MARTVRITVLPDEDVHPDQVLVALVRDLECLEGVRVVDRWIDVSAGLGETEILVRMTASIDARQGPASIERSVVEDLRRRHFGGSVDVRLTDDRRAATTVADRSREAVRDEVRRLVQLVPRGRVTTLDAIGTWLALDVVNVEQTLDELASWRTAVVPWHRVTEAAGRIGSTRRGTPDREQIVRLEREGVPVRYERVVGFRARFVDIGRSDDTSVGLRDTPMHTSP